MPRPKDRHRNISRRKNQIWPWHPLRVPFTWATGKIAGVPSSSSFSASARPTVPTGSSPEVNRLRSRPSFSADCSRPLRTWSASQPPTSPDPLAANTPLIRKPWLRITFGGIAAKNIPDWRHFLPILVWLCPLRFPHWPSSWLPLHFS